MLCSRSKECQRNRRQKIRMIETDASVSFLWIAVAKNKNQWQLTVQAEKETKLYNVQ